MYHFLRTAKPSPADLAKEAAGEVEHGLVYPSQPTGWTPPVLAGGKVEVLP